MGKGWGAGGVEGGRLTAQGGTVKAERDVSIGVTFPQRLRGQRVKSAQGTIKILLKSEFSSYLIHFVAIIGEWAGPPKKL